MTDPYVSFDTFSVGDGPNDPTPAAPQRPSLLARLPRVAPTPTRPKPIQRFDSAESPLHGVHLSEGGADLTMAGPDAGSTAAPRRIALSDAVATIRIDTVSPTFFDDSAPAPRPQAATPAATLPATTDPTVDDPWAAWLLNLEAAILPYSRVIVLAAVIAAMGLTFVLLRGGPASIEAPAVAPQVSVGETDNALVTAEAIDAPSTWPAPIQPAPQSELRPFPAEGAAPPPSATFAAGPASAWRGVAGAKLTGEVLPVEESRVEVAEVPNYPQTTTR